MNHTLYRRQKNISTRSNFIANNEWTQTLITSSSEKATVHMVTNQEYLPSRNNELSPPTPSISLYQHNNNYQYSSPFSLFLVTIIFNLDNSQSIQSNESFVSVHFETWQINWKIFFSKMEICKFTLFYFSQVRTYICNN